MGSIVQFAGSQPADPTSCLLAAARVNLRENKTPPENLGRRRVDSGNRPQLMKGAADYALQIIRALPAAALGAIAGPTHAVCPP